MGLAADVRMYKVQFFTKELEAEVGKWAFDKLVRAGAYGRTVIQRSMRPARKMRPSELTGYLKADYDLSRSLMMSQLRNKHGRSMSTRERNKIVNKFMRGWMPLKSSEPGEPPRVREGTLRKLTIFEYDRATKSVVVGPRISGKGRGSVPSVLEKGGQSKLAGTGRGTRRKSVLIKPRPYVAPGFTKTVEHFPQTIRQ